MSDIQSRASRAERAAATREKERRILELRRGGATLEAIAIQVGLTSSGVLRAYRRALNRTIPQTIVDDERRLAIARLDSLRMDLNARLAQLRTLEISPEVAVATERLVSTMVRIEARQSGLLGLDSARKVEIDANGSSRFTLADIRKITDLLDKKEREQQEARTAAAIKTLEVETTAAVVESESTPPGQRAGMADLEEARRLIDSGQVSEPPSSEAPNALPMARPAKSLVDYYR